MLEFEGMWERIEKQAIFIVLLIFFSLQIISEFVPVVDSFMNRRGSIVLIAFVLLFMFQFISKRLDVQQFIGIEKKEIFTLGVIDFLKKSQSYETIEIFAHNGFMYYIAISESKVKIKNLRLLLRGSSNLETMQFPTDNKSKQTYKQQLDQIVHSWLQLQKNGQVDNLIIQYYPFDPTNYFLITDMRRIHFGYLKPKHDYPGTEVMNSFVITDISPTGKQLIGDCKKDIRNYLE